MPTYVVLEIPDRPATVRTLCEAESLADLMNRIEAIEYRRGQDELAARSPGTVRAAAARSILAFRRGLDQAADAAGLVLRTDDPAPLVIDGVG